MLLCIYVGKYPGGNKQSNFQYKQTGYDYLACVYLSYKCGIYRKHYQKVMNGSFSCELSEIYNSSNYTEYKMHFKRERGIHVLQTNLFC